jgi:hypothetical protein
MTRHARIEIVPPRAQCDTHPDWELCPVMEATEEQCLRYLPTSGLPHHLRLVAGNGKVLASSEKYANLTNARRAVKTWLTAFAEVWNFRLTATTVQELDIDGNTRP